MNVWFSSLIVGCALLLGDTAWAQQLRPRYSTPFDRLTRVSATEETGRVLLATDTAEADGGDDELPLPLTASPPPEPSAPAWGDYLTPPVNPVMEPPLQYNLISPPRGFIQQSQDQDYRAVVPSPNSMLYGDAHYAQSVNIFRPDGMAPIGVFGDHTLPAGSTFISYRYLQNSYEQIYNGSHRIGVPTAYPMNPTRMLQDSQVALIEYGATQDFTILTYLPFQHNEINLQSAGGNTLAAMTNPGDIKIYGLYALHRGEGSQLHLNLGISIPTGLLQQILILGGAPVSFPYQDRTSSGTYDLLLGATYRKQLECWTFGTQANAVIPTGMNTLNYELGNQFQLTSWISRRWDEHWSTSARLDGRIVQNIHGADTNLTPAKSPVFQSNTQASETLNGLLGANYLLTRPGRRFYEQRLFIEAGVPFYGWYAGPQPGLSWILNAGWGMTF